MATRRLEYLVMYRCRCIHLVATLLVGCSGPATTDNVPGAPSAPLSSPWRDLNLPIDGGVVKYALPAMLEVDFPATPVDVLPGLGGSLQDALVSNGWTLRAVETNNPIEYRAAMVDPTGHPAMLWVNTDGRPLRPHLTILIEDGPPDPPADAPTPIAPTSGIAIPRPEPEKEWANPSLGTMKWIPGGTFTMGTPMDAPWRVEDELQHDVTVSRGFWLMEHEVTQGEWEAVMGSNPVASELMFWEGQEHLACASAGVGPSLPVVCVSRDSAAEFAQRLSARDGVTYRLPTEAEWEFAARGGGKDRYAGGSSPATVGWFKDNSGGTLHAACGKLRNHYGLCDMSGNAEEWTADWYGDYPVDAATDPKGPTDGSYAILRGGSWDNNPKFSHVATRGRFEPSARLNTFGLRLASSGT